MTVGVSMSVGGDALTKVRALPPEALRQALDEAAASQETEVAIRFERSIGPDGAKWAPLAAKTLKYRRGGGGPLVSRRGELSGSITRRVAGTEARVGTNYETAPFHQFGTSRGIPARPFIGLSADGRQEVRTILEEHLERHFAGGGS